MTSSLFTDGWFPGRDKFFDLLHRHNLVLPPPRPRHTTNSNHRYRKYKNLTKGLVLTGSDQLWVSDITYIELDRGCCYLHLVTDAYSHMIVGWVLSDSLQAIHSVRALEMAIKHTGRKSLRGLIHHSDRGVQYCCNHYVAKLKEYNIEISMTEDYKPTDNAIAERINGIIKQEMVYRESRFRNLTEARLRISRFIDFYNNDRPHMSIGMKTPAEVYGCSTGVYISKWKCNFFRNMQPIQ